EYGTFKIHLVPSGVFYPQVTCLIGGGVVIDPAVLIQEIKSLASAGIELKGRLFISPRSHIIMPYHKILDGLYEETKGEEATGTTRRGIGPTFADKVSYNGLRWSDFNDIEIFADKLNTQIRIKNKIIAALGGEALDFNKVLDEYTDYYFQLKPFIRELFPIVHEGLKAGKEFLLEQAMGSLLDTDWGTYPFVTGSTTIASAATSGLGIPPRAISQIIGVTKAYTTRVGAGPLPTEILDDEFTIKTLSEVAATTGRIRRGGWFDVEVVRFSTMLSGVDALFLTKLDILSAFEQLQICTGYELEGKSVHYYDLDSYQLERATPIYESLPGWHSDIREIRVFEKLPAEAQAYVKRIEELVGVAVSWIGVGPEREALIRR
ncbi:MAG: adenylosuccinate synthase, partial [Anaerolineae bacterium]|nr:adenylosuccinate synthase [Anaerolineae bacterium]